MSTAIKQCLDQKPGSCQRLYFLDGTFPGALPNGCSAHEDIPGMHKGEGSASGGGARHTFCCCHRAVWYVNVLCARCAYDMI